MNDKERVLLKRMAEMFIIMLLVFVLIIVRLFYLQIFEADKYKTMSEKNRIALRLVAPQRGNIYDRNGVELARNEQGFVAAIVAEQSPDFNNTLEKLSAVISLDESEKETIRNNIKKNRRFIPIKVKDNLDWEEVSAIELHAADLSGIVIDDGYKRFYPQKEYFAHSVGYVGAISEADKSDNFSQIPDFKIGKSGVEQVFETKLRGEIGNVKMEVNALGRVIKNIEKTEATSGDNVYLSLDSRLQKKAYEAFGKESGALVVMNVKTGEILAYVSTPSFDPNLFVDGMSQDVWKNLVNNERNPLSDKVITGVYSPGSTFKMITAIAGLRAGIIDMNTKVNCTGKFELGNHAFHCWKHSGHGPLNVVEALEHSCDVFFYDLALKVGIEKIAEVAHEFGLGNQSELGFKIEKQGIIPDKKWKMQRFGQKWEKGESVIAAIGQGYVAVTPMQLAIMTARIANGKEKVVPTILKQNKRRKFAPLNVAAKDIETVRRGMFNVVNSLSGTARRAAFDINGIKMAGKTGTTQVRRISMKERKSGIIRDENLPWNLRNHALFVGYAPTDNPLYAVAVIVEHGSSGSAVAAPIASKVLQEAIRLKSAE